MAGDALTRHLGVILPALLSSLKGKLGTEDEAQVQPAISKYKASLLILLFEDFVNVLWSDFSYLLVCFLIRYHSTQELQFLEDKYGELQGF